MLNHIVLMGRLTRDPELRRTGSGVAVASFSLAVDRDYAAQGAEKETDFVDIVAWRNTAEFVSKYFTKGRMAVVSGRLQIRNWTDKEGNKRRSAEVVADHGTVTSVDEWGKRRLAYPINDLVEGYYVYMTCEVTPEMPAELDRVFKITDGILRSIIVAVEE